MSNSIRALVALLAAAGLTMIACAESAAPAESKSPPPPTADEPPPVKRSPDQPPPPPPPPPPVDGVGGAPPINSPGSGLLPNGMITQSDVLAVVRAQTPIVKRNCWDGDAGAGASTASVRLTITVALSGNVQNASASGDEPVASCIAREAAAWRFPPPQVETPINIPFRFVRQ